MVSAAPLPEVFAETDRMTEAGDIAGVRRYLTDWLLDITRESQPDLAMEIDLCQDKIEAGFENIKQAQSLLDDADELAVIRAAVKDINRDIEFLYALVNLVGRRRCKSRLAALQQQAISGTRPGGHK